MDWIDVWPCDQPGEKEADKGTTNTGNLAHLQIRRTPRKTAVSTCDRRDKPASSAN